MTRHAVRRSVVNQILAEGSKKRSKYRNVKVTIDGHTFDSKKEAARYGELLTMQRAGLIRNLELQPKFPLVMRDFTPIKIRSKGFPNGRTASYKADFAYDDVETGKSVVEDVKSVATATEADKLRRAVVEAIYGIRIETP